jgi:hypothetical protein
MSQLSQISQRLPITDGVKTIEKQPFSKLVNELAIGRRVSWDTTKYRLDDARIKVTVDQDVTSGASMSVTMNEEVLSPVIRWHALETHEQSRTYNVTRNILRGENVITFSYEVSSLHQLAATAHFQAFLDLIFTPLQPGLDDEPASGTKEEVKGNEWWNKLGEGFQKHGTLIAVLGVVGVAAAGIGYLYFKTTWIGKVTSLFR